MMDGYNNKEVLYNHYVGKEMSMPEIARHFNISRSLVQYYLRKYSIPTRDRAVASRQSRENHCSLSIEAIEFIYGELLGDMTIQSRHIYSANISYGSKYLEYINWLSTKLSSYGIEQCGNIYKRVYEQFNNAITYAYKSRRYVELRSIQDLFYPNGKKIIPDIDFTPLVLRQWYIGDGSLRIRQNNRKDNIILSSCGFTKEDVLKAIDKLIGIGLKSNYWPASNTIHIPVSSVVDFLDYIGPCPVECYSYKWTTKNRKGQLAMPLKN